MKTIDMVMATTHVDLHSTRFTRESLEVAAKHLRGRYIPLLAEHDLLRPLGRVLGATVRQRPDGEWELAVKGELLEADNDTVPIHPGREFRVSRPKQAGLRLVAGDEFIRDPASRGVLKEFAGVLRNPVEFEGRRALEPPDLIKLAGIYLLGKVAEGFLSELGADGYVSLKRVMARLFASRIGPTKERRLCVEIYFDREGVEAILIQSNPTPESTDAMLTTGLQELDAILPGLLSSIPDVRRVVAEFRSDGVRVVYIVGADCLPREVRRSTDRGEKRDDWESQP